MATGLSDLPRVKWPEGKTFAFTIFDDPDARTYADGQRIYDFLFDNGFRTTRGVWPCALAPPPLHCTLMLAFLRRLPGAGARQCRAEYGPDWAACGPTGWPVVTCSSTCDLTRTVP